MESMELTRLCWRIIVAFNKYQHLLEQSAYVRSGKQVCWVFVWSTSAGSVAFTRNLTLSFDTIMTLHFDGKTCPPVEHCANLQNIFWTHTYGVGMWSCDPHARWVGSATKQRKEWQKQSKVRRGAMRSICCSEQGRLVRDMCPVGGRSTTLLRF